MIISEAMHSEIDIKKVKVDQRLVDLWKSVISEHDFVLLNHLAPCNLFDL